MNKNALYLIPDHALCQQSAGILYSIQAQGDTMIWVKDMKQHCLKNWTQSGLAFINLRHVLQINYFKKQTKNWSHNGTCCKLIYIFCYFIFVRVWLLKQRHTSRHLMSSHHLKSFVCDYWVLIGDPRAPFFVGRPIPNWSASFKISYLPKCATNCTITTSFLICREDFIFFQMKWIIFHPSFD